MPDLDESTFHEERARLEGLALEAMTALLDHTRALAVGIPFMRQDRAMIAVVGPPVHVLETTAQAMRQFMENHEERQMEALATMSGAPACDDCTDKKKN